MSFRPPLQRSMTATKAARRFLLSTRQAKVSGLKVWTNDMSFMLKFDTNRTRITPSLFASEKVARSIRFAELLAKACHLRARVKDRVVHHGTTRCGSLSLCVANTTECQRFNEPEMYRKVPSKRSLLCHISPRSSFIIPVHISLTAARSIIFTAQCWQRLKRMMRRAIVL